MKRIDLKEIILSGLFLALGVLLPIAFHSIGMAGKIFLPMHIPVLIGGFILSPPLALIVGFLTPILSSIFTGMPPLFPIALIMAFELATYGIAISLLSRRLSIILSLISSMALGRIVAAFTVFILSQFFGVKMKALIFLKGAILTALPGIVIQIILIPALLYSLKVYNKKNTVS